MPSRVRRLYSKFRQQLLDHEPFCHNCQSEHSLSNPLHYHHLIPQHTGKTDHTLGCLLCSNCHAIIHSIERRMHKVVDEHGYTHGTFVCQPRRKREHRKARAERLTEAWM